jgi:hypothetical protein
MPREMTAVKGKPKFDHPADSLNSWFSQLGQPTSTPAYDVTVCAP